MEPVPVKSVGFEIFLTSESSEATHGRINTNQFVARGQHHQEAINVVPECDYLKIMISHFQESLKPEREKLKSNQFHGKLRLTYSSMTA